jgi:SRSO17 transposase
MTPEQIAGLAPALAEFLSEFKDCLGERRLLDHFVTYCQGLLSGLKRKSVEPIALAAGVTVRVLQLFLAERTWDHLRLRDRLQQRVAAQHLPPPGSPRGPDDLGVIGLIDETSVAKKGDKTPGVQRQHCGASGKLDNCIVTVHLGQCHARDEGDAITLLDSDLFLPKSWDEDRSRCREAGIPDDVVYRPKTAIALAQVQHALSNGVRFDWMTFDEGYGKDPSFLLGLDALGQTWIGEVPKSFRCWPTKPKYHSLRKEFSTKEVRNVVRWSKAFLYEAWQPLAIPRLSVGPVVWHVKAAQVHLRDSRTDRPTDRTYWLIVAWNKQTHEYKYFLSNAPPQTDLLLLLRVALRRAEVEHLFRAAKQTVGLGHFEGRHYAGLLRHMILCQLLLLFLTEQAQRLNAQMPLPPTPPPDAGRGEKGGPSGSGPGAAQAPLAGPPNAASPDPDPRRSPSAASACDPTDAKRPELPASPRDARTGRHLPPLVLCALA